MKSTDKFTEIIAENNSYKTPENRKKISVVGSSVQLYSMLFRVILRANRQVRKEIYDDYNWVQSSLDILHGCERAGINVEISGMDNLKKADGPVIFISNHMSTFETVALPAIIHPVKRVVFITKKELANYPVFGPVNSARDPIIVGRENPREDLKKVLTDGAERLRSGKSIIIFPQKTRSKYFDAKNFNTLGIKLAKQNNVPIIPIALLTDAYDNGKIIKELGKIDISKQVYFEFGEPFKVEDRGNESHQKIIDFIRSKLSEWGRKEYIIE